VNVSTVKSKNHIQEGIASAWDIISWAQNKIMFKGVCALTTLGGFSIATAIVKD
jgi:hypothetical protein